MEFCGSLRRNGAPEVRGEVAAPRRGARGPGGEGLRLGRQPRSGRTRTHGDVAGEEDVGVAEHPHPDVVGRPRADARHGEERRALVSSVSRITGEPHKVIHARVNRETGAASVTAASVAQLEKGNVLLEREAARRR